MQKAKISHFSLTPCVKKLKVKAIILFPVLKKTIHFFHEIHFGFET